MSMDSELIIVVNKKGRTMPRLTSLELADNVEHFELYWTDVPRTTCETLSDFAFQFITFFIVQKQETTSTVYVEWSNIAKNRRTKILAKFGYTETDLPY